MRFGFLHFGFVWHGLKEKRLQWSFDKAHSLWISIVEGLTELLLRVDVIHGNHGSVQTLMHLWCLS